MIEYLNLVKDILDNGTQEDDRTGTGTISVFGRQLRFDLKDSFPAVTTKKLFFPGVAHELLWFLSGDTNIKYLQDNEISIWDAWANDDGELGPIYGNQWRNWNGNLGEGIDQINDVIYSIKINPNSRRHVVNAWNVEDLEHMSLVPCHMMFQFYVRNGELSCHMYQRSADVFLGLPFNIASYALLTEMIAQVTGLKARELIISIGDAHLYMNHITQSELMLTREPMSLPTIQLNPNITDIDKFTFSDIELINYNSHKTISAPLAI